MANKTYIESPGYQVVEQNNKFYCFILDDDGKKLDILGSSDDFHEAVAICEEALTIFFEKGFYEG